MTAERASVVRFDLRLLASFQLRGLTCPIACVLLRLPSSRGSSIGTSATGFENSLLPDFSLRIGLHVKRLAGIETRHALWEDNIYPVSLDRP
jgi:hypothetical protein